MKSTNTRPISEAELNAGRKQGTPVRFEPTDVEKLRIRFRCGETIGALSKDTGANYATVRNALLGIKAYKGI